MSDILIQEADIGPSDFVLLKSSDGRTSAKVYLFGAHVFSFQVDDQEKLWMSSLSTMDGSGAIRGGIPIAFPQFADEGSLNMLHGFARESHWKVVEGSHSHVKLELTNDEKTMSLWPHTFILHYEVRLRARGISLALEVTNTDQTKDMTFSGCLHTYFKFDNALDISLHGFCNTVFVDKADNRKEKIQDGPIEVKAESDKSAKDASIEYGFVDRIHYNSPSNYIFKKGDKVLYNIEQSESWTDTTVYNPYLGDKQGPSFPDFDDDGYKYTICCEPTLSGKHSVTLKPKETWLGTQTITVP